MITISIVEDDTDIRESLEMLINSINGYRCLRSYADCQTTLSDIAQSSVPPDVVLMDIGLPVISGIEGTKMLRQQFPHIVVLVLSSHENEILLFDALCAGAVGYIPKGSNVAQILHSIQDAVAERAHITSVVARLAVEHLSQYSKGNVVAHTSAGVSTGLVPQDEQILRALADGKSPKNVAAKINITEDDVRRCIYRVYRALAMIS